MTDKLPPDVFEAIVNALAAALVNDYRARWRVQPSTESSPVSLPPAPSTWLTVRDAAKAPIPGVTVTATSQANNDSKTATTAADGSFSMSVAPGSYSVKATVSGYRTATLSIQVAEGGKNELEFLLDSSLNESITVTAMKREAAVINVPFSVAAPTEQELRDRGAEDVEAVAANVGGCTIQNLGPGQSQVAVRGVSAGQIVRDQQEAQLLSCLEILEEIHDLRADRHVEGRDRLVEDDQLRLGCERARERDALALPAAELVGIPGRRAQR